MALEEDRKRQGGAHGPISEQRRAQIRAGIKAKMGVARAAIDGGAYDEVRRQLGIDPGASEPADEA